jgi:hypothetical protein
MAQAPVPHQKRMRYAYFRGCDASAAEASRAVEIHPRTGQKLDTDPSVKAEVERVKAERGRTLNVNRLIASIDSRLNAQLPDGSPDFEKQWEATELLTKNLGKLREMLAQQEDEDRKHPEGVITYYPRQPAE